MSKPKRTGRAAPGMRSPKPPPPNPLTAAPPDPDRYKTRDTEWGPVLYAEYTVRDRLYMQTELYVEQQQAVLGLLIDCGMQNLLSYNDLMSAKIGEIVSRILSGGAVGRFMQIVLTLDGNPLGDDHFKGWPATPFNSLFAEVLRDFFTLNPSLLSGMQKLLEGAAWGLAAINE